MSSIIVYLYILLSYKFVKSEPHEFFFFLHIWSFKLYTKNSTNIINKSDSIFIVINAAYECNNMQHT